MQPFVTLTGIAAPINGRNLDTNQLCPTRFNKMAITDPTYDRILFHNQRFANDGSEVADFILNRPPFRQANILVADENFGCGSSRESAVYALLAFGIRCVVAPSFGDIFSSNCTQNGLLPVVLPNSVCDAMRKLLNAQPGLTVTVDLPGQRVTGPDNYSHTFDVHPTTKHRMQQGLDDVGVTEQYRNAIDVFEKHYQPTMPWVFSPPTDA